MKYFSSLPKNMTTKRQGVAKRGAREGRGSEGCGTGQRSPTTSPSHSLMQNNDNDHIGSACRRQTAPPLDSPEQDARTHPCCSCTSPTSITTAVLSFTKKLKPIAHPGFPSIRHAEHLPRTSPSSSSRHGYPGGARQSNIVQKHHYVRAERGNTLDTMCALVCRRSTRTRSPFLSRGGAKRWSILSRLKSLRAAICHTSQLPSSRHNLQPP